jgi:hypothetical protein
VEVVMRVGSVVAGAAAWTVGAAAASGVGMLALSLVGAGLTGTGAPAGTNLLVNEPDPLVTPATSAPHPTVSPTVSAGDPSSGTPGTFTSAGGNAVARCGADGAYLVAWSPAPGYRTDDVVRGPAASVRVNFEGNGPEFVIVVTCVGDSPHASIHGDR